MIIRTKISLILRVSLVSLVLVIVCNNVWRGTSEPSEQQLLQQLRSKDHGRHVWAARSLAKMGNTAGVDTLVEELGGYSGDRDLAIAAINRLGSDALRAVRAGLSSPNLRIVKNCIEILAEWHESEDADRVADLAQHASDLHVRFAAMRSIVLFKDYDALRNTHRDFKKR